MQIIGIGGTSQSGKSLLAKRLREYLSPKKVMILEMDLYVKAESAIPTVNGTTNWEVPESIDYSRIITTIENGFEDYDFIIVEGILAFANDELNELYDTTIFLNITKETFLQRRRQETRWNDEPEWYMDHVWETHKRNGQYSNADLIFSGENLLTEANMDEILLRVQV
ncbi:uridine kinase family protein [Ekhidna sp.]|uniref:uridine kinase family protein n=1 Tax=Ekhidna sp. TaxID=2608089 RepID=UPI003B501212